MIILRDKPTNKKKDKIDLIKFIVSFLTSKIIMLFKATELLNKKERRKKQKLMHLFLTPII
jgi:hypothetical protein